MINLKETIGAKSRVVNQVFNYICYILGCGLYSFGFCYFINPNNISPGGVTGVAAILNNLFGFPTGISYLLLNLPILVLGWKKIGGAVIIKTVAVTVFISAMLELFSSLLPTFGGDRLIAAIFGGMFQGAGLALVMLKGATTGGVDIIARVLKMKFPYLSMGRIILLIDGVIVLAATLCYGNIETALYTFISLFVSSKILDYILYGADNGRLLFIITTNGQGVAENLLKRTRRGVTVIPVIGAYKYTEKQMLMCALRRQEVNNAIETVRLADENAFTVITVTGGVFGKGFERPDI